MPLASTMLVPWMVTGAGGWNTTIGTVKLKPGAGLGGVGGKGGGGEASGAGGGDLMFSRPSKISPIFVVLTVRDTGLGEASVLPAL